MSNESFRERGGNKQKKRDTALIENLLEEDYALIIGSETILEKDAIKTQNTGDSMFRVYNAIADLYSVSSRPNTDKDWQHLIKKRGLENIIVYENAWESIVDKESSLFDKELDDGFSSDLREFLEFKRFKVVITTCLDDLLEVQFRRIWKGVGKEVEIYNFMDDQEILRFINSMELVKKNHMIEMQPSLIYLFGKIGDKNEMGNKSRDLVFSEDAAIEAIARYITKPEDNLRSFFDEYLFARPLLAIGCRFDDWRFRFFWYAMRGAVSEFSKGTVAYTCIEGKNKDNLFRYLEQEQVYVEPDSRGFLKKMNGLMKDKDTLLAILKYRVKNAKGIFISYASEDFQIAYSWFKYLSEKCHFNVWIDREDLHANDIYTEEIKRNIELCGVFMPILSDQVQKDLVEGNFGRYYINIEWTHARDLKKCIFPVSVGAYNCKSDQHKIFKEKTGIQDNDRHVVDMYDKRDDIVQSLNKILLNK